MDSEKNESPGASATGALLLMLFGALFMTVGGLMFWGLTQDFEQGWARSLAKDGYATTAEVARELTELAAFPGLLASWKVREAQRTETAKAKVNGAEEGALEKEVEALRDAAEDWEPRLGGSVSMPLPEGLWARFVGLSTGSRVDLFKGVMVSPVPFMIGLFIALGGLSSLVGERGARKLSRRLPERPWLHVSQWSALEGSSSASSDRAGIVMMLCVFGWAAFCMSLMWVLEPEPPWNFTFVAFMAVFCSGVIFVLALRRLIQGFKFGTPRLLLAQVPIEPGKTFVARLTVTGKLAQAQKLEATLKLEKITTRGVGEKQRTNYDAVFVQALVVPREAFVQQGGRLAAELRFEVTDPRSTRDEDSEPGYRWIVEVRAETPGVDFDETFVVPVYPLGANQPLVRTDWS